MTEKFEMKKEFDSKNGVTITWNNQGDCFVAMPVNSIPKKQFDEWIKQCKTDYSGKRWDMIHAEHIKAKAYDVMMMQINSAQQPENIPEEEINEQEKINPLGLMNGGQD